MKLKTLAVIMAAGMAASAFGQGIILDNLGNAGGISATSGGRVYVNGVVFDGINANLGVVVSGGAAANSLAAMGTFTAATDPKGYTGADAGQFQLGAAGAAVNVPGVSAGGTAWIQLQIWYNGTTTAGLFPSFAAAQSGGGFVGTVLWFQGVSNPQASPPLAPPNLGGMPSVNLAIIPEPSMLALGAMGLASLLIFRRRS